MYVEIKGNVGKRKWVLNTRGPNRCGWKSGDSGGKKEKRILSWSFTQQ